MSLLPPSDTLVLCGAQARVGQRPIFCSKLAGHRGMHSHEWADPVWGPTEQLVGSADHHAYWSEKSHLATLGAVPA